MTSQPTLSHIVGEFPRLDAFAAVRALEHAGINAEAQRLDDTSYRVAVAHEHAERARSLV